MKKYIINGIVVVLSVAGGNAVFFGSGF